MMFLVVVGGDRLSILETEHCVLLERGQTNRLSIAVYGLPRPGVKGGTPGGTAVGHSGKCHGGQDLRILSDTDNSGLACGEGAVSPS